MEDETGRERRQLQRFSLRAAALVETESLEKVFELQTRDISAGGAFFPTDVPLPSGEKVKITLFLSIAAIETIGSFKSRTQIVTHGRVVRSTNDGVAVAFGEGYSMTPAGG